VVSTTDQQRAGAPPKRASATVVINYDTLRGTRAFGGDWGAHYYKAAGMFAQHAHLYAQGYLDAQEALPAIIAALTVDVPLRPASQPKSTDKSQALTMMSRTYSTASRAYE
jgi:hypothetical protein